MKLVNNAEVWLASVRLELTCDNSKIANHLLARALQQCPDAGRLWAQAIEIEPAASRLAKSTDAVKHVKDDPNIFMAIGKIFWVEKKQNKARKFFQQAVHYNKDNGDAWLCLYNFEKENQGSLEQIRSDFLEAEPRHGSDLWAPAVKNFSNWKFKPVEMLDRIQVPLPKY